MFNLNDLWKIIKIRHKINRRYAPTHLSYKKLQKETLCDIQLSSIIFLQELILLKEEFQSDFSIFCSFLHLR